MKYIPINALLARSRVKNSSIGHKINGGVYPLLTSYKEDFNYENIKESVDKWDKYSRNVNRNVEKMLELHQLVQENGSIQQIEAINNRIIANLETVQDLSEAKYRIKHLKNAEPLLEALDDITECDKVIDNHKALCTRFGIDEYVQMNVRPEEENYCIHELCSLIDTYNVGLNTKYRRAIDECIYAFAKNGIKYPVDSIVEDVSTYFLMLEMDENDTDVTILQLMKNAFEKDKFVTIADKKFFQKCDEILHPNDTTIEESEWLEPRERAIDTINQFFINESSDTEKAITAFKLAPVKDESMFKKLTQRMFNVKREEDILDATSNWLSLAFWFFIIVGIVAVSCFIAICALVVAIIIAKHLEYRTAKKVLARYHNARAKAAMKLEKTKDPQKKKRLEEFIKGLDMSIEKLEDHFDRIRDKDGKSAMELRPSKYNGSKSDEDDFDFGLECAFFGVEGIHEAALLMDAMGIIPQLSDEAKAFFENSESYTKLPLGDINYITNVAQSYKIFDESAMIDAMKDATWECRKKPTIENYTRIAQLNQSISELALNMQSQTKYAEDISVNEAVHDLCEACDTINHINQSVHAINELGITSHIKLALDKAIDTAKGIDVKAQMAARTIDGAARLISKKIEDSMTLENREAVIRGEILPSLSKCIKLALVVGGAWLINPVIAIIIMVGKFALSSRIRKKEKQLVLNELDVELQMVDKYIQQAEEKKDMKKLRELLLLKKKLQSQYARLRYNIKIEWQDKDIKELRGDDSKE